MRNSNFGILIGYILLFWAAYFFAAEFVSFDKSRGEVLLFRRRHFRRKHATCQDEESGKERQPDGRADESGELDDQSTVNVQKQDNIFHWSDVCYDITIEGKTRKILDHVDGWVKPGTLTALMVCYSFSPMTRISPTNQSFTGRHRSWKDHVIRCFGRPSKSRCGDW
jgi:ATP-binding cassette, subfamily G (WHITE), member 2, PDR